MNSTIFSGVSSLLLVPYSWNETDITEKLEPEVKFCVFGWLKSSKENSKLNFALYHHQHAMYIENIIE